MGVDLKIHWNFFQEFLARQGLRFHTGEVPEHEAALVLKSGIFRQKKHDPRCPSHVCRFTPKKCGFQKVSVKRQWYFMSLFEKNVGRREVGLTDHGWNQKAHTIIGPDNPTR